MISKNTWNLVSPKKHLLLYQFTTRIDQQTDGFFTQLPPWAVLNTNGSFSPHEFWWIGLGTCKSLQFANKKRTVRYKGLITKNIGNTNGQRGFVATPSDSDSMSINLFPGMMDPQTHITSIKHAYSHTGSGYLFHSFWTLYMNPYHNQGSHRPESYFLIVRQT